MYIIHLAQILWDYHHLNHPLEKVDCIVVFGGIDIRTAERAAELFLKGYAPLMIMTGKHGVKTKKWDMSEAEIFRDIAIAMGVPAQCILVEKEATNTGENILFTKKLLKERGIEVKKIIAIQKPYTERRLFLALEKQWPEVQSIIASPTMSFEEYPVEDIPQDHCIINTLVSNLQKIITYPDKGFQTSVEIPQEVMNAYHELIRLGFNKFLSKE